MASAASATETLLGFLPGFRRELLSGNASHPPCEVLTGILQPFSRQAPELILKLAVSDAQFFLDRRGGIKVDDPAALATVRRPAAQYPFEQLKSLTFQVEVWFPLNGAPPQFFSTAPLIDHLRFPDHPHMYRRRELTRAGVFANALCVYPPHLDVWQRAGGDLYTLMALFSLWLAKHAHFERTGSWLGPAASHHPAALRAAQELRPMALDRPWWMGLPVQQDTVLAGHR